MNHQVEHDADVGRAAGVRREPVDFDESGFGQHFVEVAHDRVEPFDMADLKDAVVLPGQRDERLGIADRVSFLGNVARSEVPGLLAQASVLVLARPRSPQADAGMPTKVAEYLASGVPTVLTRTGEIGAFLRDGVSAYLVPPDDGPALTAALDHVLNHGAEAAEVGRRGRDVAVQNFDYRVVGAHVAAFVARLRADDSPERRRPV